MRKPTNKFDRLTNDLKALEIGDTISHAVNLELRQFAYDEARRQKIKLCVRELPTKAGRFEITRTK